MSTCHACNRDAAPATGVPSTGEGSHPLQQSWRDAALLLRVWQEDGGIRARLLGVGPQRRTVATAQGIDAICDGVRTWLRRL